MTALDDIDTRKLIGRIQASLEQVQADTRSAHARRRPASNGLTSSLPGRRC